MYTVLLSFLLIIALGVGWRRLSPKQEAIDELRRSINLTVFNLFLPALCIKVLAGSTLSRDLLLVPVVALCSLAVALTVAVLGYGALRRRLNLAAPEIGTLVLASVFGNVTYLGLPVLTERFGAMGSSIAICFDLFASTPMLWLAGVALAAHYGGGEPFHTRAALRTLVALPPIWGSALGVLLALTGLPLPQFVINALGLLAGLVVPLMIFSIGLALRWPDLRRLPVIVPAVVIKMALVPVVTYLVARTFALPGTSLTACTLEGAMPTMVLTLLIAQRFGLDDELAALCITVTTCLSFVTLPLVDQWSRLG